MKFKNLTIILGIFVVSIFMLTSATPVDNSTPVIKTPPKVLVSLGDSITQAANACEPYQECPQVSWSTGETPETENNVFNTHTGTFKEQIEKLNKEPITVHNNARSYTKVNDLPNQAQLAVTQQAEFITILSGANDLCVANENKITSPESFKDSLTETLNILNDKLPKSKIFIASIPNIYQLWETNHNNLEAVHKWDEGKLCQSMLENPTSNDQEDTARRARVALKLEQFNNILEQVCVSAVNCSTDNKRIFNTKFENTDLSEVDFFHPSVKGQQKIASTAWNNQIELFSYIERGKSNRSSNNAPIISMVQPLNNSVVSGKNYRLIVKIEHVNPLKKVYADTQLGGVELKWDKETETWFLPVDTTLAPNNLSTSFIVIAVDKENEVATSERVTVKVFNPAPEDENQKVTPSPSSTEETQPEGAGAMFNNDQ